MLTHTFWSIAQIGAEWVLYVLVILSLVSIALMVERGIYFSRQRVDIDLLQQHLRNCLRKGGPALARQQFSRVSGVVVELLSDTLKVAHEGAAATEEVAAGARGKHKLDLERGLVFLGTLGNNAPFIGLFGTVLGIINAFQFFTQPYVIMNGTGGPNDSTLFYAIHLFNVAWRYLDMGYASAMAWILFVVIMGITLFVFKSHSRWVHYGG